MQSWCVRYHKDMDNPSLPGFQSACCILEKRMLVGKSHPSFQPQRPVAGEVKDESCPVAFRQNFAPNFSWNRTQGEEGNLNMRGKIIIALWSCSLQIWICTTSLRCGACLPCHSWCSFHLCQLSQDAFCLVCPLAILWTKAWWNWFHTFY